MNENEQQSPEELANEQEAASQAEIRGLEQAQESSSFFDEAKQTAEQKTLPSEPPLPAHFEQIPEEKIKKARRTKRTLIIVIILLVLLLAGGSTISVYYYLNLEQPSSGVVQPNLTVNTQDGSGILDDTGTTETRRMPQLAQLFGKTADEALALLGSDYVIAKTDSAAEGDVASGAESPDSGATSGTEQGAEGEEAPAVAVSQVVTISLASPAQATTVGTTQVHNIYLSMDSSGKTIEVYFASSMNMLGYPISGFGELVSTRDSFVSSLAEAGAAASPDSAYTAPTKEEYTQYVDAEATSKMVAEETATMTGALASSEAPNHFEVTYTYDYGASGVADTPDKRPVQRMLYIKLSTL